MKRNTFCKSLNWLAVVVVALSAISCTEDTATIGAEIMPSQDNISASQATYRVLSRSVKIDSVLANTNECYLGSVIDPETRARTTCDFLAQFHVMDSYLFPKEEVMLKDENGNIVADSCDIRIYFDEYYGDSLATMKLLVQELDTNRVMEEMRLYYSNLSPDDYVSPTSDVQKSLTYTVSDLTREDGGNSSTYYRSVVVRLPASYGTFILKKYYEHPEYFKNSYHFIHHVCPGFYFKTSGGVGSMLKVHVSALNVYFRYQGKTAAGNDTIMNGMQRMAATAEVIQNTRVENVLPAEMLDSNNGYTYVKTPTGIFTELTLPMDEIVGGEHYSDSINCASMSLRRYNNAENTAYSLQAPPSLLLVRSSELFTFFERERLSNSKDSYISTFNETYGAYTFENISALIALLRTERNQGAGVLDSDSEAIRVAKWRKWEAEHPDWNKVMLVPVTTTYSTSTNSYGYSTKTLLGVKNEMGLYSVKLEGGSAGFDLDVIYSRFSK